MFVMLLYHSHVRDEKTVINSPFTLFDWIRWYFHRKAITEKTESFKRGRRVRLSCESFWTNLPTSFVVDDRVINIRRQVAILFILFDSFCWIILRWERTSVPPRDYWEQPIKIVATHITFRPFPVTTGKTRWQLGVKNELELTSLSWFGTF